jgi:hypothetical protein
VQGRAAHGQREGVQGLVSGEGGRSVRTMRWREIFAGVLQASASVAIGLAAVAANAEAPELPNKLLCTYDASGGRPAYDVIVAFDEKSGKFYTSRGGKISSADATADQIVILHTLTLVTGEREVTTTTINRHTGKVVITLESGAVLESGTCVSTRVPMGISP